MYPKNFFPMQAPSSPLVSDDEGKPPSEDGGAVIPDEAFLMVTQDNWESKILWDVPYSPNAATSGYNYTVEPLYCGHHWAKKMCMHCRGVLISEVDLHSQEILQNCPD